MQWPGVDTDGDEGEILAPGRQGHRVDTGGGKPPPSTVTPVWHAGSVEGPEWDAQAHIAMYLGSEAEVTAISGGGG